MLSKQRGWNGEVVGDRIGEAEKQQVMNGLDAMGLRARDKGKGVTEPHPPGSIPMARTGWPCNKDLREAGVGRGGGERHWVAAARGEGQSRL